MKFFYKKNEKNKELKDCVEEPTSGDCPEGHYYNPKSIFSSDRMKFGDHSLCLPLESTEKPKKRIPVNLSFLSIFLTAFFLLFLSSSFKGSAQEILGSQQKVVEQSSALQKANASQDLERSDQLRKSVNYCADFLCYAQNDTLLCNGDQDGEIWVKVVNGNRPFQYKVFLDGQQVGESQINNPHFENLGAGHYRIVVCDAQQCVTSCGVWIVEPPKLQIACRAKPEQCFEAKDGIVQGSASGGTPPYTYQLLPNGPSNNTGIFKNLAPGSYGVKVTDANRCMTACRATVEAAKKIHVYIKKHAPTCFDGDDGKLWVYIKGGAYGFKCKLIRHDQKEEDGKDLDVTTDSQDKNYYGYKECHFHYLKAGKYWLIVKDKNHCIRRIQIIIKNPKPTISTTETMDVSCFGGNDGSLWVNVEYGHGPFKYKIPGGEFQDSGHFHNLEAGVYPIIIKDGKGCKSICGGKIGEPEPLYCKAKADSVSCFGGDDGRIWTKANGGTPPYHFKLISKDHDNGPMVEAAKSDEKGWYNKEHFDGLTAGKYCVLVKDYNRCYTKCCVEVGEPLELKLSLAFTLPTCKGESNGSITASVLGGTGPYTFKLNGIDKGNLLKFLLLKAGLYKVEVKDANGCIDIAQVLLSEPDELVVKCKAKDQKCPKTKTGAFWAGAEGGTPPYKFKLNDGDYQEKEHFYGLHPGIYTVTVKDSNGCEATCTDTVKKAHPPIVKAIAKAPSCHNGNDGKVWVYIKSGPSKYHYSKDEGDEDGYEATLNTKEGYYKGWHECHFHGLEPGKYCFFIWDKNRCKIKVCVEVPNQKKLVAKCKADDVTCFGGNDGKIWTTVYGGTPPYKFKLISKDQDNGPMVEAAKSDEKGWYNKEHFDGLEAGKYCVLVKDYNRCFTKCCVEVGEPLELKLSLAFTLPACKGESNGSITASVLGGTGPYTLKLNGIDKGNLLKFLLLKAGLYKVEVKDANGCIDIAQVLLSEPDELVVKCKAKDQKCPKTKTGAFWAGAEGGTPPYKFKLNDGDYQEKEHFYGLHPGIYTVTVKDSNGCEATCTDTVKKAKEIIVKAVAKAPRCHDGYDGSVWIFIKGGNCGKYHCSDREDDNDGKEAIEDAQKEGYHGFKQIHFNYLKPGKYCFYVWDCNKCKVKVCVEVPNQKKLVAKCKADDVTCFGGNDGKIWTKANGGTPPYHFKLISKDHDNGPMVEAAKSDEKGWYNKEHFDGLEAGKYCVLVKDYNRCYTKCCVEVGEPLELKLSLAFTLPTCKGESNGSITASVLGGTGPYTFKLNGIDKGNLLKFLLLKAGLYKVEVKDANGCIDIAQVLLSEPDELVVKCKAKDQKCPKTKTGAFWAGAEGGTPPYKFKLNDGDYQEKEHFYGLHPGIYTVTVKDSNGCEATCTDTVKKAKEIIVKAVAKAPRCHDGYDGSVWIFIKGGSCGKYHCSDREDDNDGKEAIEDAQKEGYHGFKQIHFNYLKPGKYCFYVWDCNKCKVKVCVEVPNQKKLVAKCKADDVTCFGGNDGKIWTTVYGGTPPYKFKLISKDNDNDKFVEAAKDDDNGWYNKEHFDGLEAGKYCVLVKDYNRCFTKCCVEVGEPLELKLSLAFTLPTCKGESNGSITASVLGGTGPYTFKLNGIDKGNLLKFLLLKAGLYTVEVKDANGCIDIAQVLLSEPEELTISCGSTPVRCHGEKSGFLWCKGEGGTPPYEFKLNDGEFSKKHHYYFLGAGVYTVMIRDSNGCISQTTDTITEPDPLKLVVEKMDVTCNGNDDGKIWIKVSGGNPGYFCKIRKKYGKDDNGEDMEALAKNGNGNKYEDFKERHFDYLKPGKYWVIVIDKKFCYEKVCIEITEPEELDLKCKKKDNDCFWDESGAVWAYAKGGTPPYTFSLNGSPFTKYNHFKGLMAGDYTVVVRDSNNCEDSCKVTIYQPKLLLAGAHSDHVSCFGESDGKIIIKAKFGTPPYKYQLGNNEPVNTNVFDGLAAGTYNFKVIDANGCMAMGYIDVGTPDKIVCTVDTENIECEGNSVGSATVNVSGGVPPYMYKLDDGDYGSSNTFSELEAGSYEVTIKDSINCTKMVAFEITEPDTFSISLLEVINPSCDTAMDGSIEVILQVEEDNNNGPFAYSLNGGNPQASNTFGNLGEGNYVVTVTDTNGCVATDSTVLDGQEDCPGITSIVAQNQFAPINYSFYPNPWNREGTINLTLSSDAKVQVSIFNVLGEKVMDVFNGRLEANKDYQFNVNPVNLPTGIYYSRLNYTGADKSAIIRIVKSK